MQHYWKKLAVSDSEGAYSKGMEPNLDKESLLTYEYFHEIKDLKTVPAHH